MANNAAKKLRRQQRIKTRTKEEARARKNSALYGKRDYVNDIAVGLTAYTGAVKMLKSNVNMFLIVKNALDKSTDLLPKEDHDEYVEGVDKLLELANQSTIDLGDVFDKYIGETKDGMEYAENIPEFTRNESIAISEWVHNITNETYTALSWTQTSLDIIEVIANVYSILAKDHPELLNQSVESTEDVKAETPNE